MMDTYALMPTVVYLPSPPWNPHSYWDHLWLGSLGDLYYPSTDPSEYALDYPIYDDERELCDMARDPNCKAKLSPTDSTTIRRSFRFFRPTSSIVDPRVREECRMLGEEAWSLLFGSGNLFRGAYSDFTPVGRPSHSAQTVNGRIVHIDGFLLDSARTSETYAKILAHAMLHEAGHRLGRSHPNEVSKVVRVGEAWLPSYTDVPFSYLTPDRAGNNSCLYQGW
jgi:hypothetical protein